MSQFFDDLEAQLSAAAAARTAGRRPAPRRRISGLRRGLRFAPVLASGLVAVAVAAVVLTMVGAGGTSGVGAGGHSRPPVGPSTIAEAADLNRAFNRTLARDPACAPRGIIGAPRGVLRSGRPNDELLSILGILRRPATAADKLSRGLGGPGGFGLPGYVYVHYIRFTRSVAGVRYYVVVSHIPGAPPPPRRCYRELRSAVAQALPRTLPRSERTRVQQIAAEQLRRGGGMPRHPYDAVFLVDGGAGGGLDVSEFKKTGLVGANGRTISGVVPDGVATVELPLRPVHGYPHLRLTAPVVNNVFVARAPRFDLPTGETWLSPSGKVIYRVNLNQ